ncbi:DUF1847 domain-containing protein [Candidatus Fermentibacterales bacterium]|nr:DUF1847 domain-containing protein [Candidatus Fermentibacterales bacterium]
MNRSKDERMPRCAHCAEKLRACVDPGGTGPSWCPTLNLADLVDEALEQYGSDAVSALALAASVQEGECYADRTGPEPAPRPVKPRALEICEFAAKLGMKRIGVAFCTGLFEEARIFSRVLESRGFEVVSVACKAGRLPKETIGVRDDQKIRPGCFESMCSPIAQAMILDRFGSELNVLIGLCVGHDSLFFRFSRAPVTVLVAKDRVTGHNPAAALYTAHSYYRNVLSGPEAKPSH